MKRGLIHHALLDTKDLVLSGFACQSAPYQFSMMHLSSVILHRSAANQPSLLT
jgi:hypothetical protein